MKKYILFFLLLPAISYSQSDTLPEVWFGDFRIEQLPDTDFALTLIEDTAIYIQGDTMECIRHLFKQYLATNELLEAAEQILTYTKTDGRITNWRKWDASVKRYMKIKQQKQ